MLTPFSVVGKSASDWLPLPTWPASLRPQHTRLPVVPRAQTWPRPALKSVMPVTPMEIMLAKIWANGLVIVGAAILSLQFVVEGLLGVPVAGSILLFAVASVAYLFSVASLGILLATISSSMAQFGLLVIPTIVTMMLLSGSATPLESMPEFLQNIMQISPSTHFVALAQSILYRGAGLDVIWPRLLILAGIGAVFFGLALSRFRRALLATQ